MVSKFRLGRIIIFLVIIIKDKLYNKEIKPPYVPAPEKVINE